MTNSLALHARIRTDGQRLFLGTGERGKPKQEVSVFQPDVPCVSTGSVHHLAECLGVRVLAPSLFTGEQANILQSMGAGGWGGGAALATNGLRLLLPIETLEVNIY